MNPFNRADITARTASLSPAFARGAANALVVTLLAAATPEWAMAGPATGTYGTRDQVRQCASEQGRLDAQVLQRQQAHKAHVAALAKLEAESAEITRRQAAVNPEDEAAVSEFNEFVAQHNANADKINQEALESRAFADTYNAEAASHNQRCAGLLIRPEDLAVVAREQARAASTAKPESARAAMSGASQAH